MKGSRRAATWLVDHKLTVIGFWVVVSLILMPLAAGVENKLAVAATVKGSESARVEPASRAHVRTAYSQTEGTAGRKDKWLTRASSTRQLA